MLIDPSIIKVVRCDCWRGNSDTSSITLVFSQQTKKFLLLQKVLGRFPSDFGGVKKHFTKLAKDLSHVIGRSTRPFGVRFEDGHDGRGAVWEIQTKKGIRSAVLLFQISEGSSFRPGYVYRYIQFLDRSALTDDSGLNVTCSRKRGYSYRVEPCF